MSDANIYFMAINSFCAFVGSMVWLGTDRMATRPAPLWWTPVFGVTLFVILNAMVLDFSAFGVTPFDTAH